MGTMESPDRKRFSMSDYLEPTHRGTPGPVVSRPPAGYSRTGEGWYGRLTGLWGNMVSTLRSSGRARRTRRAIGSPSGSRSRTRVPERLYGGQVPHVHAWNYVASDRLTGSGHTYYNLIEECSTDTETELKTFRRWSGTIEAIAQRQWDRCIRLKVNSFCGSEQD